MLAHLFLNHVLDAEQAFMNFSYIVYQQPLNAMTPRRGADAGLVPPNLDNTLIHEPVQERFRPEAPLSDARADAVGERLGGGEVRVI